MLAGSHMPTDSAQKHAAHTNLYLHMNLLVSQASRVERHHHSATTSSLIAKNRPNEHTRGITSQDSQTLVTQFTCSRFAREE